MRTILRSNLRIEERTRKINEQHAQELAKDIEENGLLQPAVIKSPADPLLVIGGHRNRAIEILAERGVRTYRYDGMDIGTDKLAVLAVGDLSPAELLRMELAENVVRLAIDWQDKTWALARLHESLAKENAEQTPMGTARAIQGLGDKRDETTIQKEVTRALVVAQHLDNATVAGAKTIGEAFTLIRKQTLEEGRKAMANLMTIMGTPSRHTFHKAPFLEVADQIKGVDLMLCDPPYGIGADTWTSKFRNTPHAYDDDKLSAMKCIEQIFNLSFQVWTNPLANLFMFCSADLWHEIRDLAEDCGWTTWPRPLIWKKSNEGIRPWGISGFAYTYEAILYATKGQKGLLKSISDVIEVYKVSNFERSHGAQKPVELYQKLIEIACHPSDVVCDPTCGSGTIFEACELTRTTAIGCEVDSALWPLIDSRIVQLSPPENVPDLFDKPDTFTISEFFEEGNIE